MLSPSGDQYEILDKFQPVIDRKNSVKSLLLEKNKIELKKVLTGKLTD